jgi:DUF971 family protein
MASTRAKRITIDVEQQEFSVDWTDGHRSVFSLDGLRRTCPCASCAGGHEQMGTLPDPELFLVPALQRWLKVQVEAVGSYGIRFTWDDGHDAGIYTWERLRTTCPCPECRNRT